MADADRSIPDAIGRGMRRLRVLLQWKRHDADMAEEIALHEEMKRDALIASGMSHADAVVAARVAMGNVTSERETSRAVWRFGWLRDAMQDVSYGARALRRSPAFALVAILGLSLGLGFSAAVFTGFNAFALRGWELPEPDRMVALWTTTPGRGKDNANPAGFTLEQMEWMAQDARSLDGVVAHIKVRPDGTGALTAAPVSARYLTLLGVPMTLGRNFVDDEDRIGAPSRVLILSHRYWTNALSRKADIVGSTLPVNGVPFTVIGVGGAGFDGTNVIGVDGWIPMAAMPVIRPRDRRSLGALAHKDECCVDLVARLAPGVSRDAAAAELSLLLARHVRPGIDTIPRTVVTLPFTFTGISGPDMTGDIAGVFALIGGGVAAVLLLACANVANLLLARATARQREMSIRLALGASRGRIVRQLMTESLLLASLASVPALLIARWAPGWIVKTLTEQTHTLQFSTDWHVLLFTMAIAVTCCVLFGLAPALHASRPLSMQRQRLPLRSVFLSAQITFCVVLLVAAGLFARSANVGRSIDLGFATRDVTELRISLPATDDEAQRSARLAAELPQLAASLGIRGVAYSTMSPFNPDGWSYRAAPGSPEQVTRMVQATPEYFALLGIRLVAGRVFASDSARREIVVNTPMAKLFGGAARAIGATLLFGDQRVTIVGVTGTTHDVGAREVPPAVYSPFPWTSAPRVIVRGTPDDARRLAAAIMSRDPSLLVSLRSYAWYVRDATTSATFAAMVSGAMGLLALILATVGMFGVLSYWVQQRQQDISVRMALGAAPRDVVRLVFGASGRAVGWGLALGLVLAIGAAQLLRSNLFGLSPLDPAAYGGALAVLALCALLATLLPVRRAVRIEPMRALRGD